MARRYVFSRTFIRFLIMGVIQGRWPGCTLVDLMGASLLKARRVAEVREEVCECN